MRKFKVTLALFILLSLITTKSLFATDYYVSSSQGNDSNNGTSQSSPWKTLHKINQTSFLPGDVIHFKRGDVWKEDRGFFIDEQGTPENPIIFTDYGNGDLPEINLLVTLPHNLPWTDEGNNIWSIILDDDLVANSDISNWSIYHKLKRLIINGQEVLGAAVDQPSELGTFIPDQVRFYYEEGDSRLLKVYSTANPNTLNIELSYQRYAIHIEKYGAPSNDVPHDLIIENFKITGGDIASIKIAEGNNIVIKNIDCGAYTNYGISIDKKANNIVINSCYIDSRYNFDYSNAGTNTGKSNRGPREGFYLRGADYIEFKNSVVKNFTHANINTGKDWSGNFAEYDKIHDNYTTTNLAYGGRTVIEAGTRNLEYYNNFIDGSAVNNQINGQNGHYHHNIIKNVISTPLKHYHAGWGISLYPYSNSENISGNIFENNLIMDCESGGINIRNNSNAEVTDNIFRNNMLINNGKFVSHFSSFAQNQTSNINLAIKISDHYDWNTHQFVAPIVSGNTFQNNLIYVSNDTARFLYHLDNNDPNGWTTASINISQFNSKNGQNADVMSNNIESDPLFIDLTNGDYHLQSASPAIDNGITELATLDLDGNQVPYPGTTPDIGIYEYQNTVNISETNNINTIFVCPNPVKNKLIIKNNTNEEIEQIVLFNILGKIVLNKSYTPTNSIKLSIDISILAKGIYILKVKTIRQNHYIKLIKR